MKTKMFDTGKITDWLNGTCRLFEPLMDEGEHVTRLGVILAHVYVIAGLLILGLLGRLECAF